MGDRAMLLEMGFAPDRVDWALYVTKNAGLQPALDHLEANQDKPVPSDYKSTAAPAASSSAGAGHDYDEEDEAALADLVSKKGQQAADDAINDVGEAKSIKCSDCGKVFKSPAFASFHAEKSGHTSFEESTEEIKPLTEEEKKAKLEELRIKLAAKRAAQSKIDAEEHKANEKIRRKAGQDLTEIKEEMKRKEQIKEAERLRKEKADDAAFKARIKAQIENDKRERAEKAAAEKAARERGAAPVVATPAGPSVAALAARQGPPASMSSANEARLRVRAPGGMWMGTLPADAKLSELADKIRAVGKDGGAAQLKFSTTFPRKIFDASDASKTLRELGLVPSAALEASAQ
ncbi:related to chicken h-caldesmon, Uso1p and YKL201c [Melanopsichium pennsylvanicum]|uniref:Related to chicken h-caldesmon, Uso1p and YKL201c n=2 Tax=Melanopsichium pennsylvanicum TaxID=63383 RepID=A0AAJ4XSZ5_9BASI|nr:dna-binding protein [Melanopsichium pennsylvanicum 4]SNX86543.1 related to chicken h-caldesmon, Uso1p and YKL201c [Melanopsichium pennsylvanicum]